MFTRFPQTEVRLETSLHGEFISCMTIKGMFMRQCVIWIPLARPSYPFALLAGCPVNTVYGPIRPAATC